MADALVIENQIYLSSPYGRNRLTSSRHAVESREREVQTIVLSAGERVSIGNFNTFFMRSDNPVSIVIPGQGFITEATMFSISGISGTLALELHNDGDDPVRITALNSNT